MQKQIIYLQYIEEIDSFAISKEKINSLKEKGIVADIRLPDKLVQSNIRTAPKVGFLLGQDTIGSTEYYSISQNYTKAILNTKAKIRFLDYDYAHIQMKNCHGAILPGGNFDFPESYFISGHNLGLGLGKRFYAYKSVIEAAYKAGKPILGICAGAQMLGAILGKMKMYTHLNNEVSHPDKHKPTKKGEVCMHNLKLFQNTPLFSIMGIPQNQDRIAINSRHEQAMVINELQDYTKAKPIVKMDIYAVSEKDDLPEIWGNEDVGILCVQGHPEDLAANGNMAMQNIYNYVVSKADEYKQKLKINMSKKS